MEQGVNTREMIEYYRTAKERIDNLAVTHARALREAEEETIKV